MQVTVFDRHSDEGDYCGFLFELTSHKMVYETTNLANLYLYFGYLFIYFSFNLHSIHIEQSNLSTFLFSIHI